MVFTVGALRRGDRNEFTAAYEQLAPRARLAAQGVLQEWAAAEDVVQDVFVRLLENPGLYDPERGPLGALVVIMARSRAIDAQRRSARLRPLEDREDLGLPSRDPGTEQLIVGRETAQELLSALRELPGEQRAAVLLHYVGDFTDQETARATMVPLGTAKSRMRLGMKKLRDAVLDNDLIELHEQPAAAPSS